MYGNNNYMNGLLCQFCCDILMGQAPMMHNIYILIYLIFRIIYAGTQVDFCILPNAFDELPFDSVYR